VHLFPLWRVRVSEEYSGFSILNGKKRMAFNDSLGEKVGLSKDNVGQGRVIGVVNGAAHVGGLEQRAIFFEQPLMIAEMVWIHLKVVSNEWKTLWTGDFPNGFAIDGDGYILSCEDICDCCQGLGLVDEPNAC
jgi:hypothetical protein